MVEKWKKLSGERVVDCRWIKVDKDKVQLPNGQCVEDFYTVTIADAASIVALTPQQEVVLKREYKYACREELIEIPAGMFEPEEKDGLAVARRELLEETGYTSDNWTYLGATVESSSKLTNRMHIYLAQDCRKVAEQKLDATEQLDVMVVPLQKAIDMIMTNEICCNSSAHGILKAALLLKR